MLCLLSAFQTFGQIIVKRLQRKIQLKLLTKTRKMKKMQNSKTSKAIPLLKSTRPPNPRLSSVNVRDVSSIGPGGHMGRIAILECSTMLCMLQIDNNF